MPHPEVPEVANEVKVTAVPPTEPLSSILGKDIPAISVRLSCYIYS